MLLFSIKCFWNPDIMALRVAFSFARQRKCEEGTWNFSESKSTIDCASLLQPCKSGMSGDLYLSMPTMKPNILLRGSKRRFSVNGLVECIGDTALFTSA